MGYFVTLAGSYHEGDALPGDTEVTQRPSQFHIWHDGAWVYAPTAHDYVMAVQGVLDTKAQERAYDGILSACSYATSTNAKFTAEGQACVAWRDDVWAKCYGDLAKVQTGEMAQPTIEDFLASLPALAWPEL